MYHYSIINNSNKSLYFDIISESILIDSDRILSYNIIPILENKELNSYIIKFTDIQQLSEENNESYIDSLCKIAESNNIDPYYCYTAINEYDIISNPIIYNEIYNPIIISQSENSLAYQFCESCINNFLESNDEYYIDILLNEVSIKGFGLGFKLGREFGNIENSLKTQNNESMKDKMERIIKQAKNKSGKWISQKIASLRKMLNNWMHKYENTNDNESKGFISKVMELIQTCIDKLFVILEKIHSKVFGDDGHRYPEVRLRLFEK